MAIPHNEPEYVVKSLETLEYKDGPDLPDDVAMEVWGYASTYEPPENPDSYGDIIKAGALKAVRKPLPMIDEHGNPVGYWHTIEDDRDGSLHGKAGLFVKGYLLKVSAATDLMLLIKNKVKRSLSIGFRIKKRSFQPSEVETWWGNQIRVIEKADLEEVSLVMFPANRNATIDGAKNQQQDGSMLPSIEKDRAVPEYQEAIDALKNEKDALAADLANLKAVVSDLEMKSRQGGGGNKTRKKTIADHVFADEAYQKMLKGSQNRVSVAVNLKAVGDADVSDVSHPDYESGINMLPDYQSVFLRLADVKPTSAASVVIDKEDAAPDKPITTVATTFSASAESIVLTNVAGLGANAPFNAITITDGTNTETVTILTVTAATNTITCAATTNGFAAGSTVYGSDYTLTAEGVIAPRSRPHLGTQTLTVKPYPVTARTSLQQLADIHGLQSIIEDMLRRDGRRMIDVNILLQTTAGGQQQGLLASITNINWSTMAAGTNKYDALVKAYFAVINDEGWEPNGIVVDTTTFEGLDLLKGTDGHYLIVSGVVNGVPTVREVPIEWCSEMPANTAVIGDWSHLKIRVRQEMIIEIGVDGNDFSQGMRTIYASTRMAFGFQRTTPFRKVTYDSAPT